MGKRPRPFAPDGLPLERRAFGRRAGGFASATAALVLLAAGTRVSGAAPPPLVVSGGVELRVETLARGLEHPWGLALLPDGRMLVTERPGRLRLIDADGTLSPPLAGVPAVYARGQGGLLDVALAPDFSESRRVFLCYAEASAGGAGTATARGILSERGLSDVEVIFRQQPKVPGDNHFGCRLVFRPDGTLFLTLGERFKFAPAQDLQSHLGKIVRINPDGSVPPDNPFIGSDRARPEIWSLGHRNVQGAAIHPLSGALWTAEFGPLGGLGIGSPE